MESYKKLLANNKAWASSKTGVDPDFFERLLNAQKPEFLWIGCSDSRVPANEVTGTNPGEIFVHRNIANLVVHTDLNLLSVLQYAVEVLKVKHIIVCGHYGCGGVKAAMEKKSYGLINRWLGHIKDVYQIHKEEVSALKTEDEKWKRMVELNTKAQVLNLAKISVIQKAWKYENLPHLHAWVYDLKDGMLHSIFDLPPGSSIDEIYEFEGL